MKKRQYIVTIGGKPTNFGLAGLFGSKRGVLIPSQRPHLFGGEKSALKAIERLNKARHLIGASVVHDWSAMTPLFAAGPITVEPFTP
jgi:hypothetical protein